MLEQLASSDIWLSLLTLSVLEVVLGLDNIIFISILVGKLPPERRDRARRIGLIGAFVTRVGLLSAVSYVMHLQQPLFVVLGEAITGKELVLLLGGLFLLYKATKEIHERVDGPLSDEEIARTKARSVAGVVVQILLLDLVFSIDSVVTAVGMAQELAVMIAANVIALFVMLRASKSIAEFVDRHPSVKILALSFLLMIGLLLIAEAFGIPVPKGYVYFAMGYSVVVEMINIRASSRKKPPVAPAPPA